MARFEIESLDEIACGEIDLAFSSPHCVPVCAEIVEAHRVYLGKYLFCNGRTLSRLWRGIPLVIDLEFDAALSRIKSAGVAFYADFNRDGRGQINHLYGGRGFYFDNPDGRLMEVITRPYGPTPERWADPDKV